MWANNETGVLFPIEEIAEIAQRETRAFSHRRRAGGGENSDSSRGNEREFSFALRPQIACAQRCGRALRQSSLRLSRDVFGGSQENGRRAGTENVASIVALGKAAERAAEELADEQTRTRKMRDRFETAILATVPQSFVNGDRIARLPNTSNLSFAGVESDAVLLMLDQQNICCSAGSACKTGSLQASHVLRAMNLGPDRSRGSLRFSFGRFNTEADVDRAIEIVPRVISKLRALSPVAVVAG